jgi:hypothetical protein
LSGRFIACTSSSLQIQPLRCPSPLRNAANCETLAVSCPRLCFHFLDPAAEGKMAHGYTAARMDLSSTRHASPNGLSGSLVPVRTSLRHQLPRLTFPAVCHFQLRTSGRSSPCSRARNVDEVLTTDLFSINFTDAGASGGPLHQQGFADAYALTSHRRMSGSGGQNRQLIWYPAQKLRPACARMTTFLPTARERDSDR